ncbi:MAG: hypothetical protein ACREVB_14160, partial [Burkholderiales bacterium]
SPTYEAHANDVVWVLLTDLADGVQRVLIAAARDAHLMSVCAADRGEHLRICRAMFAALLEILL